LLTISCRIQLPDDFLQDRPALACMFLLNAATVLLNQGWCVKDEVVAALSACQDAIQSVDALDGFRRISLEVLDPNFLEPGDIQ